MGSEKRSKKVKRQKKSGAPNRKGGHETLERNDEIGILVS